MDNKCIMIGVVDWYNKEKGYGVIKSIPYHKEYFIHQSQLSAQHKRSLVEDNIVLFSPDYDKKRNREIATDIQYFNTTSNIQMAINLWIQEDYLLDKHLERITINYLKDYDKDEHSCFKDAYNHLIEIICPFLEIDNISRKLFSILKKAILSSYEQQKSSKLLELTYLILMEKLPNENYFRLLDSSTSPYVFYVFALNATDYLDKAIQNAIDYSKDTTNLLEELIRFAKDINSQNIKDSLDHDKSLITNNDFISSIVGERVLSEVNRYVFSSCDSDILKNLIKKGYICEIDNPILKHDNPDCYKALMIYALKEGLIDHIDIEFVKENLNEFSVSEIIKLNNHFQLADNEVSDLYLCLVRKAIISKQAQMFRRVLVLATEIKDLHKWIKDNHSYLADNAEEEYQEFMIWLYKNCEIKEIDESFVNYYIDRFDADEIFRLLDNELIGYHIKESILTTLFKNKITSSSPIKINVISQLCNRANDLLKEHYSVWFATLCAGFEDETKYILWKNKVSDMYPSDYVRDHLLGSEESGYAEFYELYQKQLMSAATASNDLWSVLIRNDKVENRPTFYKILYCIKYLMLINSSYKEAIEKKKNDHYTLILWFLSYSNSFNYDLLCRHFIYFLPNDQVQIVKRLFFMAENDEIQLKTEMLDSLLRVDADLYKVISEHHPEIPVDVSSEIVIRALISLSKKGNFSTDKDVLTIIIQAGQYNKSEKFEIGNYFDKCKGRKVYKWDGNRRVNGCVKQVNESFFSIEIYPHVEERVYTRGMGYHIESVWNDSFHEAVSAVKSIKGRRWNAEKSYWEVPIEEKEPLFEIAKEYGFEIDGTNNSHMRKFKEENEGCPARVKYCEGRPALKKDSYVDKDFLWCRNGKCFGECVKEHCKEEWENYTLLDFCRILGLETDSVDSAGRVVKYGKYLNFSSLINRANSIIDHLYCRECGEMLEPVKTSNYHTHLVTHFYCTNVSCGKFHDNIYISKCFNWKCNGVIDDRDTKKCPNGWNICPECGSCCSTRTAKQRADNDIEIGKRPNPYFIDFVNNNRGHLEKKEYYCWKCSKQMNYIGDSIYECPTCEVNYYRKFYDYEPRSTTIYS